MKKHVFGNPFVLVTSLAAIVHSTWSLGIMFTGYVPAVGLTASFLYWLIPSFFVAVAIDVGLMATSADIRAGNRHWGKLLAFLSLSLSMYFLQFLYIAHHMPDVTLGAGVRSSWLPLVGLIRDAALFAIPGLLPLSISLYTVSPVLVSALPARNVTVSSVALVVSPLDQSQAVTPVVTKRRRSVVVPERYQQAPLL